jgi:hypothetical protein
MSIRNELLEQIKIAIDNSSGGGGLTPAQLSRLDRLLTPTRITGSFTVPVIGVNSSDNSGIIIDSFPSANNTIVTLPNPADVTATLSRNSFTVTIYNQTDADYNVIVHDHLGAPLGSIPPVNGFTIFYDSDQVPAVSPWEFVHIQGAPVPSLDVARFGDFNSINWDTLKAKEFTITGTGAQFLNSPWDSSLLVGSTYTFDVNLTNEGGVFIQAMKMTTNSDFGNENIGRLAVRAAVNFSSAAAVGWRSHALVSELYPPALTGENKSKTVVLVYSGNVTDSVASADIDIFVTAKHNSNQLFPSPVYDTGVLSFDNTEAKMTNISASNYSFTVTFGGILSSNSTSNTALIRHRLNSTGGVGTGTLKTDSAGPTGGSSTVEAGYSTDGAFTLAPGESMWLEVSKNVSGTLVMEGSIVVVTPIF